ncbi:hypothetical protein LVJ94_27810 [Pendulispora rubella]|uniref:Uncharacterized protein n=1 Tax=Pendulispora rubella TaxID=2741070 RepID=A0ABZ2KSP0_9BACT
MRLSTSLRGTLAFGALTALVSACSSETATESSIGETTLAAVPAASDDILADLRNTPGVGNVQELTSPIPDTRYFLGTFEQPIDHRDPDGPKFTQRFTFLYRSRQRPTVLAPEGYGIALNPYFLDEPTYLLAANRLQIEHRFFGPSTPPALDWTKLDVYQAAADQHRLVQAIRPLVPRKWLSTGGSKGGVTATFHRYFYPDDVWATIAYVAPTSYGRADPAYIDFLEHVGDAACRDKLKAFQTELLRRRPEIETRMADEAAAAGDGYQRLGIHKALDFTVTEAPFIFWQYLPNGNCVNVPAATASTDELYAFLSKIYGQVYDEYGDASLDYYAAYYYQAATELGAPGYDYSHMRGLLTPHFRDAPQDIPPLDIEKRFHPATVPVLAHWVRARGERMLYLYGGNDPWSSRPFEVRARNDSYRYIVPNGNHRSLISYLPEDEKRAAFQTLSRWMDTPITPLPFPTSLDATGGDATGGLPVESPAMWRRYHPRGH